MLSIRRHENSGILLENRRSSDLSFSPLLKNGSIPRRSYSYHKLPQQLLKLSVLKLDDSCFEVQISRMGSVAELKQAVEDVFTQSPKEGQEKISWSHVWGHFCLCYEGQKILNDKAYIRTFGIKDGDQLHFIRHLSINYNPKKKRSKNRSTTWKQHSRLSPGSDVNETKEENAEDGDDQEENVRHYYDDDDDNGLIRHPEFKLAHFLKGWLSYTALCVGRTRSGGKVPPSRFSRHYIGVGSKATRL